MWLYHLKSKQFSYFCYLP